VCSSDLGGTFAERAAWGGLAAGTTLDKCALFPRVEAAKA